MTNKIKESEINLNEFIKERGTTMKVLLKNVNLLDGTKDMHLRQGVNILVEDGKFKKITTAKIINNQKQKIMKTFIMIQLIDN